VFFFLACLQILIAQKSNNVVNVPRGIPLISGLAINPNGWKTAVLLKSNGGDEIYLVHDTEYLYVGFRGVYEPWSHLYLNNRSNLNVLHITPSMGRVVYNMNNYGTWRPDRQFNWKMKDKSVDYETSNIDPKKFLEKEGWITCINSSGDKKEVVFKINLKNYDKNNLYIAWVYGFKNNSYLYWPLTLNDDTLKPEIFTGYNPSDLKFNLKNWALLKLE